MLSLGLGLLISSLTTKAKKTGASYSSGGGLMLIYDVPTNKWFKGENFTDRMSTSDRVVASSTLLHYSGSNGDTSGNKKLFLSYQP